MGADLQRISRRLNKRLGGGHEMLCTRVSRSRHRWAIAAIDALFRVGFGERGHCAACYRIDHPPSDDPPGRARRAGL